ncbi:hypothetical protein QJS10_CPA06g00673 [Acorus calamus]|uniref:Uncharacterized protein n=1 Tax=Acorus calamus TaxID=4465 RepID=A0AAV9ENF3_ACOCL|nr:hypothetical protein QJS10_CPA06g00673 [Acorus calamus]
MASFPDLPKCVSTLCVHASLSSPPTSPDCMLLLSDKDFIFLSRLGDLEWAVHRRDDEGERSCARPFSKGRFML